jgi:1-acyl-sn-glycerol-3-phosphate acyltransferase
MKRLRIAWTMARVLMHVLVGLVLAAGVFRVLSLLRQRAIVGWWARRLLVICGVRARVVPAMPGWALHADLVADALRPGGSGAIVVLNHVSWLDIFVALSQWPVHFIAKAEIGTWPLLGLLTRSTGVIFIERGRRHAVRDINLRVAKMLSAGALVGVFPEGTTTDGERLLPFHANLLQPAIDARVPVVVLGVRYRDRDDRPSSATLYTQDIDLLQSLMRIVGGGPVFAELRVIDAIETVGLTRQDVARRARAMIAASFGFEDETREAAEDLSAVIAAVDPSGFRSQGMAPGTALDPRDELL